MLALTQLSQSRSDAVFPTPRATVSCLALGSLMPRATDVATTSEHIMLVATHDWSTEYSTQCSGKIPSHVAQQRNRREARTTAIRTAQDMWNRAIELRTLGEASAATSLANRRIESIKLQRARYEAAVTSQLRYDGG